MSLNINQLDILIGKKVRHFRKKMGWGLKLLSYELGISIPQLQKYEKGENKVSASLLYSIAQIFEISVENFFTDNIPQNLHKNSFNILLIEDDLCDESAIREIIENSPENPHLYVIKNAENTIDFFQGIHSPNGVQTFIKPDLIILELHLSKTGDINLLQILKKNIHLQHIPIIILTNTTNVQEVLHLYNLQASSVIIKLPHIEDFKSQIQTVITYWTKIVTLPKIDRN